MTSTTICGSYGQWTDWEGQARPVLGASKFWQEIRKTITIIRPLFSARLCEGSKFYFWLDAWSTHGPLRDIIPQLFTLSSNPLVTITEDLAVMVLRGSYGATIDWAVWSTPRRGDSAFMQGLRPVFSNMQSLLFRPCVGDGASFSFWEADWSVHGSFRVTHPRLYALARDPGATVQTVWDAGWFPSLPSTLSDQ